MSFRKYGGTTFSAKHNNVNSNINNTNNLYVTNGVGQTKSYIDFYSDISCNNLNANQITGLNINGGTGFFEYITCPNFIIDTWKFKGMIYANGGITGSTGSFQYLSGVTGYFKYLECDNFKLDSVNVGTGTFNYVTGSTGSFQYLTAKTGNFDYLNGSTGTVDYLTIGTGYFQYLIGATGFFEYLTADKVTFDYLTTKTGSFDYLTGSTASVQYLTTNIGSFNYLTGATGSFQNLTTGTGAFQHLTGATGSFQNLTTGTGSFQYLTGATGSFQNLTTGTGTFQYLTGATGSFQYLECDNIQLDNLTTGTGTFDYLTTGTGSFQYLTGATGSFQYLTGATGSFQYLECGTIQLDNVNVGTGTFQYLTAGTGSFQTINGVSLGLGGDSVVGNIALGDSSLISNTFQGTYNTAIGYQSLNLNTNGTYNTALGYGAGNSVNVGQIASDYENTFVGADTAVSNSTATVVNNSTALGYGATITNSNQIVLGNVNVTSVTTSAGISCATVSCGTVTCTLVNASGSVICTAVTCDILSCTSINMGTGTLSCGQLNCTSVNTNGGTISAGVISGDAVSCSTLNATSIVSCASLTTNGGFITVGAVSCTALDASSGTIQTSGIVSGGTGTFDYLEVGNLIINNLTVGTGSFQYVTGATGYFQYLSGSAGSFQYLTGATGAFQYLDATNMTLDNVVADNTITITQQLTVVETTTTPVLTLETLATLGYSTNSLNFALHTGTSGDINPSTIEGDNLIYASTGAVNGGILNLTTYSTTATGVRISNNSVTLATQNTYIGTGSGTSFSPGGISCGNIYCQVASVSGPTNTGTITCGTVTGATGSFKYLTGGTGSFSYLNGGTGSISYLTCNNITTIPGITIRETGNAPDSGGNSTMILDLNLPVGSSNTSRAYDIYFNLDVGQGAWNGTNVIGDCAITAGGGNNASVLNLTTWSSTAVGVRITNTDVAISGTTTHINGTTTYLNGTTTYFYSLTGNSGATVTATSFTATSDYRIKENVKPLDDTFTVDNLRPVIYTLKDTTQQGLGLIAHELQEEYPFMVTGEKDGDKTQSVNYTYLIGILVKEIQDLKQTVSIMKTQIADLQDTL